ncbi:hypothetical protein COV19_02960 [Candidatus Woesearchaeota archaeon CG10_big_fil_rev_8_21_14_0_10_44_13]|nr:MAG: hypothetical protein COV19_02960 [Candidatus Woesearchaeota archaeon CG10_big_fil_rev_8_21_14_0_10_44_13]
MKRTIMLMLVFLMTAIVLAGCSSGNKNSDGVSITATQQAQPQSPSQDQQAQPQTTGGITSSSQDTQAAAAADIKIKSYRFDPVSLTIKAGTTVRWTNEDSAPHSVILDNAKSPLLQNGGTYQHTFAEKGIYGYSCGVHPSMKGEILVQ